MKVKIYETKEKMGKEAAATGANKIIESINYKDKANIILATGASQFEMMEALISMPDIDWSKVTMFHLDEYVGMSENHPASFRRYLKERFLSRIQNLKDYVFVNGDAKDLQWECQRLGNLIKNNPIDVAFVGIGENSHLAFNDPPANFETEESYIVVKLDENCRKQQLNEGWFNTLEEVPKQAITMTIKQIMKSKKIIATVPDTRKAKAVKCAVEGDVTNKCPSSILQDHSDCYIFLDSNSAALLEKKY